MSYAQVIRHVEHLLNCCGDPVRFTPTGRKLLRSTSLQGAVEVLKVDVLRTNDCSTLPPPGPPYAHNLQGLYAVNIIHIPLFLAGAYSTGNRYPDEELTNLVRTSTGLFSCNLIK